MAYLKTWKSSYTKTQIEQAFNFMQNKVADPYDESATYKAYDYVTYNGRLYQCTEETTGTFDSTKWVEQKIFDNDGFITIDAGELPSIPRLFMFYS